MVFRNNIAYAITEKDQITQSMINCIRASFNIVSLDELAHNNDRTKVVLKFCIDRAEPMSHLTWLDFSELMAEIEKPEWQSGVI